MQLNIIHVIDGEITRKYENVMSKTTKTVRQFAKVRRQFLIYP